MKNYGIRLDSGDIAYISKKARKMLDEAGFSDAVISASSDLDEYLIGSLKSQGAKVTSWGVGTNLITSSDCPSFGGVYKLVALKDEKTEKFIPKIKVSENTDKITNPGNKMLYRIYDRKSGKIKADLISLENEKFNCEEDLTIFDPVDTWKKTFLLKGTYNIKKILVPVFKNGECIYNAPSVMEIREHCIKDLSTLWDESRRLINPHIVHVDLSDSLYEMKKTLLKDIKS